MKKRMAVLCVALGLIPALAGGQGDKEPTKPAPLTEEQRRERLQERNRLWAEVQKLRGEGKLTEAVPLVEKALAIERTLVGDVHEVVAASLGYLAGLQEAREDLAAARKARQETLNLLTRLRGPEHWQVTDARLALAHTDLLARLTPAQREQLQEAGRLNARVLALHPQGKLGVALPLAQQALEIRKQILGEKHPDYALSMNNLAALYEAQGDYAKAEPLYQEALEIRKQALGEKHPDYAASLNNLALQYHTQGNYARAEPLYRQALEIRKQVLGEKHPLYVASLNNLAALYQSQGDYAKAEPLFQQALEIRKQVLGEKHPDYALSLHNLASLYMETAEYAKAEPLSQQALEIVKQTLGEKHPHYATCLRTLARVYLAQSDYARAASLCQRVLEVVKQTRGERHPDYANSLNNLAELYMKTAEYAKAEPLSQQALEIVKQTLGEKHPRYATSLNNLALLYEAQGDYAKAEPLLQQALEIRKQALGEKHPDYSASLNNLAGLHKARGNYAQAVPLYQQALEIVKQALGDRHPAYATSLNNLAGVHQARGEYTRAESLYRQALEIRKQVLGEKHPAYATGLNNLALLYEAQDYAKAEPLYQKALEILKQALGEKHPDYSASLNNLARLYYAQGDYAKAEPLYQQALENQKQALGEKHPLYALSLNNLAELYVAQGDYAKAEPLYQQALGIDKQVLGEKHPLCAAGLNNLAVLYQAQGDYAKAEPLYQKALETLRQTADQALTDSGRLTADNLRPLPITITILDNQAFAFQCRAGSRPTAGQLRVCDRSYGLAAALLDRLRQEVLEHADSKVRLGVKEFNLFPARLGVLQQLFALEGKAEDLEAAFTTAEQGTARVFLETLGKSRAHLLGGVSSELRAQELNRLAQLRRLEERLRDEDNRPQDKRNPERVGQILDEQKQVEAQLRQLIARMERDFPQYAALKYPKPCSLAEARACLARNEVALLYVTGSTGASYVVLVEGAEATAPGLAIYRLAPAADLAEAVAALTDPDTLALPAKARALAAEAYQLLLAPLAEKIKGKDLLIVPGGPLCHLPFELLIDPAGAPGKGRYLVEGHRLRYAPSLTALHLVRQWEKTRARPERTLWALGDPVYEATDQRLKAKTDLAAASQQALAEYLSRATRDPAAAGLKYERLHFSGQEVQALRDLFGAEADALTGLQASEATVKAASEKGLLARARYIHFATHGILGLDTGRQPSLVLSLVGNEQEDGFLQLDEVTHLKLNADLVVLSACRSGQGRLHNGEGVRGLSRAFLYAGSRGVLCSLWSVDDKETAELMTDVYRHLKDGKASPDALREAQLKMIRDGKPPLYWAPFILIGE